jgi:hypothetical protein
MMSSKGFAEHPMTYLARGETTLTGPDLCFNQRTVPESHKEQELVSPDLGQRDLVKQASAGGNQQ